MSSPAGPGPTGSCESSMLSKTVPDLRQYCSQRKISPPEKQPPGKILKNDYIAAAYLYDMGFNDKDATLCEDSRRLLLKLLPLNKPEMAQMATDTCSIQAAAGLTKGKICEAVLTTILDIGEVPGNARDTATPPPQASPNHTTTERTYAETLRANHPDPTSAAQQPGTSQFAQRFPLMTQAPRAPGRSNGTHIPATNGPESEQRQHPPNDVYSPEQDLGLFTAAMGHTELELTREDRKKACIRIASFAIRNWPEAFPELTGARRQMQWVTELVDVCRDFSESYCAIQSRSQDNEAQLTRALERVTNTSEALQEQTYRFTRRFGDIMARNINAENRET